MSSQESRLYDVVVVGELNVDLILNGDVTPAFGQVEQLVNQANLVLGSSSAIFACGAARLGLRTAFIGKVGDDPFGRFEVNELIKRRVDVAGVVVDPKVKTGLTVILSRGADRAILTYLGSISALRYDEVNLSLIAQARHLHLGSYFLLDSLKPDIPALFEQARAHGLTVSLDTNYDPAERWNGGLRQALQRADIFLPNEKEACAIAGLPQVCEALERLAQDTPAVAVKMGAQGAMARYGTTVVQSPPLPITVVDTVGAGDTFDAGFVYGHLAGWSLEKTLRMGVVCGSLSTRQAGGIAGQPTLEEAIQYL